MRLIRYFKNHKLAVLIVVVLLVGQAYTDLSLPRLTSDIVDVGIQQSGVEHVAADEMTARTYELAAMMLPEADEEVLARSYDATDAGTYLLNDEGKRSVDELDALLAFPLAVIHNAQDSGEVDLDGLLAAHRSGALSKQQVLDLVDQAHELIGNVDDSIIEQQGIVAATAEYESLGYDMGDLQMSYLLRTGAMMLGYAAASMMLSIMVGLVAARTGAAIGRELRDKLFSRVMAFSEGEIGKFSAASLITRGTNDIQLIQMVCVMGMRMVLNAPIISIGGIIMVLSTNAAMGWIIVVAVAAVFAVIGVLFKVAMPKFRIMQKLIDRVNLVAREMLTGMPVVRAFDREELEEQRFDEASTNLMKTQLFTNRAMTFMMPVMMLIMNATSVAIVWVGGHYVDAGTIQTGDLIAFITYSMVVIMSFLMIGMISIMLPRADVAAARIDEVLACEPSIHDPLPAKAREGAGAADAKGSGVEAKGRGRGDSAFACTRGGEGSSPSRAGGARIAFNDVSFRYDDTSECVLEHVSFVAEPGTTLAIIGATGSGKSTILKLIERFYDVSAGSVTIDGVDVRDMTQSELRCQLGYVPQKAFLFSGTVESNVAYSDLDMPEKRVGEALDLAQAADFVAEREGGVTSTISQGGTNVSGGQRQRLAIARALAANSRALLFDDSFSALDYKTDAALRAGLDERLGDVTRVIVAQRISTVMDAERIVVIDDGRVVGQGTHRELMKTCGEYRDIALSQLSEEELAMGGDAA